MSGTEATPWFVQEFTDLPDKSVSIDPPQTGNMRPRFTISGYRRLEPGHEIATGLDYLIRIDCTNSSVHPGAMVWNQEDKRGYFTHALKVSISLPESDGYVNSWSFPGTTREGGSTTTSESTTEQGGFFGLTGTASYSGSISASSSQTFPDFEIYNNDGIVKSNVAEQVYRLRLANGARYVRPTDMIDDSIYRRRVRDLCPAAVSKFDVISSALFKKSNASKGPAITQVSIDFTYTVMYIEKSWVTLFWTLKEAHHRFVLPDQSSDADAQTTLQTTGEGMGAGYIVVDSIPVTVTGSWKIDVDMDNGKADLHG